MQHIVEAEVREIKRTWDKITCDKCGKLLDMNREIGNRRNIVRSGAMGTDYAMTVYFRVFDSTYPDAESEYFCHKCLKTEVASKVEGACKDFSYEIEGCSGVVVMGEITEVKIPPVEKKEDQEKLIQSINNGTHPIIVAEEEMLGRALKEGNDEHS